MEYSDRMKVPVARYRSELNARRDWGLRLSDGLKGAGLWASGFNRFLRGFRPVLHRELISALHCFLWAMTAAYS